MNFYWAIFMTISITIGFSFWMKNGDPLFSWLIFAMAILGVWMAWAYEVRLKCYREYMKLKGVRVTLQ